MTLTALTASRPWLLVGWTMLHFLWVGGLLGLVAAGLRRVLRKARPELRYTIAMLGLAALAGAPVVIASFLLKASRPMPPQISITSLPTTLAVEATSPRMIPRESSPPIRPISVPPQLESRALPPARAALESSLLTAAARGLPGLWLVGAPATFALLATGLIGAERLRRQSRLVTDGELLDRCRRLAKSIGVVRPVALGVCDRLVTPVLLGVVRPMILLPTSALTGWSPEQVEMALLHELAHIRRLDNLFNLVQRTIEAVLFFHPAVWWVSAWVRLEREHCCDEVVIAQTGRARPYAELLAALAVPGASSPGRAAVAMAEAPIVVRIRYILKLEDNPMRLSRAFVALVPGLLIAPAALITSQAGPPDQAEARPPATADRPAATQPVNVRLESLFREAKKGVQAIKEKTGRVMALIQIAEAQARTGDRDAAGQTLAEAATIAREIRNEDSKSVPHPLYFIAEAQAEAGFRNEAIASLRTLLQIAETPPQREFKKGEFNNSEVNKPTHYRMMVGAQARLGDEEGVRLTLEKGRRFHASNQDKLREISTSRLLVALQASSRDLIGALRMLDDPALFQGRNAVSDRHFALLDLVRELKAGDDQAAAPILERAKQSTEVNTDEVRKPWAKERYGNGSQNHDLGIIAMAEARLGRFSEAAKTARTIDPLRVKPVEKNRDVASNITMEGTITYTVTGSLQYKDLGSSSSNVVKFTKSFDSEIEDLDTEWDNKAAKLAWIGEAQAKAGEQAGARGLAEEVVRIAERIRSPRRKQSLYKAAIQIRLLTLDFEEALRMSEGKFMNADIEVENHLLVAKAQSEANDKAGARATLDIALRRLKARIDHIEQEDATEDPSLTRERLLGYVGLIQARQGDLQSGLASIKRIANRKLKSEAIARLGKDRASMNDPDGAIEVVSRLELPEERAEAVGFVMLGLPHPIEAASQPGKASPR
ncbi:BlaR1 peptidase M56 [Singulisphaera sp. GP187]|uniref:M56 family metallopeptidase n=1 Tax=Singulisphaera sp. GP187 TaxID=1882752 RepID=UPI00092BC044|nr:M56 family metallopeptidase [Singulisphaera sp. GP187]SIO41760.1 BlaR1 peptidase M56 [Singulisphaera sp. GP187]